MKRLLPLLLILCLLLTSCIKVPPPSAAPTPPRSGGETSPAGEENAGQASEAGPFALYPAYLQLPLGQHVTLDADSAPAGSQLVWSSSNTSVAAVDESGRVTPVAEGEAVITCALADNAGITSTCGVLVAAEGNIFLWEYEPEPVDEGQAEAPPVTE